MSDERLMVHDLPTPRVVLGAGAIGEVLGEVRRLSGRRVLILDGLGFGHAVGRIEADLGAVHAGTFVVAQQHVPADLASAATKAAAAVDADVIIAVGGGSAVGVAKIVARETGTPIVAVPTTYAGSEVTPIWGLTTDDRKATGRDLNVLPKSVIYDPELTISFPPGATAASGMNAVAHCVEALWMPGRNPVSDAAATEGLRLLAVGLRASIAMPSDIAGRENALRGAWLAGTALAIAGTGVHHKICHALGGTFNLPHADVHAVVLPAVVAEYEAEAPAVMRRVAGVLDADSASDGLRSLVVDLGAPRSLAEFDFDPSGVDVVTELVATTPPPAGPGPVTADRIRSILQDSMRDHHYTTVS